MKAVIKSALALIVQGYNLEDVLSSIETQIMPQSVIVLDEFEVANGVTVVDQDGNILFQDLSFELADIL